MQNSFSFQIQDLATEAFSQGPDAVIQDINTYRLARLPLYAVHDQGRGWPSVLCGILCKYLVVNERIHHIEERLLASVFCAQHLVFVN